MLSVMDQIAAGAREWPDIIGDRPLIVSVSGGKDSTAMALWLIDQGLQDRCTFVFADTKWEHPDLYTYMAETLEPKIGQIHRVTSKKYPGGMPDMVRQKGAFPSRMIRFCTEHLKVNPLLSAGLRLRNGMTADLFAVTPGARSSLGSLPTW